MINKSLFFAFFLLCTIACSDAPGTTKQANTDSGRASTSDSITSSPTLAPTTGLQLEPRIRKADSLQVLYFDNPDGDSIRYTRFYKYLSSGDGAFKNMILSNIDKSFQKVPLVRKCRSEGKIFLFAGEDPVKTLYFSTRGDTCSYLYMISSGEFIYFNLDDSLKNKLKSSKKLAKTP